jgi:hypothetical protein
VTDTSSCPPGGTVPGPLSIKVQNVCGRNSACTLV